MILFFIRRYNDIDHVVPIVYRMCKDGYTDIAVLSLTMSYSIKDDYRLEFLREQFNVRIDYVHRFYFSGLVQVLLFYFTYCCRSVPIGKWLYRKIYYSRIWRRVYDSDWVNSLLIRNQANILVFDWHKTNLHIVKQILRIASYLNIRIIGVPHGGHTFTNKYFTNQLFKEKKVYPFGEHFEPFDFVILQDNNFAYFLELGGFPRKRIKVLGSSRYCEEWIKINRKISKPFVLEKNENLLKILYLDHHSKYRIHSRKLRLMIDKIISLDFIDLIIKPTTSVENQTITKIGSMENSSSYNEVYSEGVRYISDLITSDLVAWADVVIGTTTSALLEATIQNKTLIMPKYLHKNDTVFEKFGACWLVNSDSELIDALKSLKDNIDCQPYGDYENQNLLNEVVYGGLPGRDVLGEYKDFILSFTK